MGLLSIFQKKEATKDFALTRRGARVTLGEMATRESAESIYGFVGLLPNPDPVLKKAGLQLQAYRELLCDEHLGSVVDTRKDTVRELEWSIDRGKAKSRQARYVEEVFRSLDVYQIITEMLDAPLFGYQPMEMIWEERDGLIQLTDVVGKPQEWFAFNKKNVLRYLDPQAGTSDGVEIPEGKFVTLQHERRYTNPYGFPVLSRVFWPVSFAKGGLKFWITFLEKYGMPWTLTEYPDDAGQTLIDEIHQRMDEAVQDAVFLMPQSTNTTIIPNGQRASAEIYSMFIDLCEKRISKAILGHGAAADSTAGRLGNEEAAMDAKWGRGASDKRLVTAAMNKVIGHIHRFNFDSGEPPEFKFYEEEEVDQATAERDQKLYAIGWRPTEEYLIEQYGFEEGTFGLLPSSSITETVGGSTQVVELVKSYEARQLTRSGAIALAVGIYKVSEDEVEGYFVEDLPPPPTETAPALFSESDAGVAEGTTAAVSKASASTRVAKQLIDPIQELLEGAGDFEAALELLAKAYPGLGTEELEKKLTELMFMSDVLGRLSETEDA